MTDQLPLLECEEANTRFSGRTVVVTGGASGIGAATAFRLAREGAHVVVADLDAQRAERLVLGLRWDGYRATAHALEVSSSDGWKSLRQQLAGAGHHVTTVVNNAYTLTKGAAHELPEREWHRQLDVDLSAVYHSVGAFMPDLLEAGGTIVNVASVHGLVAWRGHPAYAAAKGGLLALTRQLAVEYGPQVRVNAVVPGPILTPTWDGVDDDERQAVAAATALLRLGRPAEVAAAIAFLASDDASYVTGAQLVVDGGQTITGR